MIIEKIVTELEQIKEYICLGSKILESTAPNISQWSIAQHLDHLLKVNTKIISDIKVQKFQEAIKPINIRGRIILLIGILPRGRAQSPEMVIGLNENVDTLHEKYRVCLEILHTIQHDKLKLSDKRPVRTHPYFGGLNTHQWLRFISIHNHHHFKIIDEIIKNRLTGTFC